MHGTNDRLAVVDAQLGEHVLQPLSGPAEGAEGVVDGDAPIDARDELASDERTGWSPRQSGLMQAEYDLDDEGNAVLGVARLQLVLERLDVAARSQEAGLEMLASDDAEMLGRYRLAVLLHRRQQFLDARVVDALDAEELRQRLMGAADLGNNFAPHDRTGQAAKFGQEVPHGAFALEVAIPRNMRSHVML